MGRCSNFNLFLQQNPRIRALISIAAGCFGIIGLWILDYFFTGNEITFTLLYLIPIAFTTWFGGLWIGFAATLLSTLTWFLVYVKQASFPVFTPAAGVNIFLKLGVYSVFTFLLHNLHRSLIREKRLSRIDALTQALNRRAFKLELESEIARSFRYKHPLSLVYFDVDGFKSVNDTFGHGAGDGLLKKIVATAFRSLRKTDVFARMGGDEFVVLLPETGFDAAKKTALQLQSALDLMVKKSKLPCSFSMGLVTYRIPPKNPNAVIRSADQLMYYSKRNGKNRITAKKM